MSIVNIGISIDTKLLDEVEDLVAKKVFVSRSEAIQIAVREMVDRLNHRRLAEECAKFDPQFHKTLAEEGMLDELDGWPEY